MDFTDHEFLNSEADAGTLYQHEMELFQQFQHLPFVSYKEKRLAFLKAHQAEKSAAVMRVFRPNIAVFAGSFNPFHKGHYNVLQKAETIFDKVIIAFGKNPEKNNQGYRVPQTLKNRQIESYDGLLTDFVLSLGHDAVVVRGLRNSTDFQYEQNQYRYIQELMPHIRIVSIFCDKEFEHISSSGIRTLEKFGRHRNYLLE
jgi:pantetheine-phosphate adenylyltransferase